VGHGNGRHADCRADTLRQYRAGPEAIVTEFDLEPGSELQRMHQRILAGDRPGSLHAILSSPVGER
jgi:Bacterial transcriptional activator domain